MLRRPKTINLEDIENRSVANSARILDSLPSASFENGTVIAPFVNLGTRSLSERTISRRHLAAPLVGAHLVRNVRMNVSFGDGTFVDSPAVPLTNILIGEHTKAVVLGETPEGNRAYLTSSGYIGESIPATPQPHGWKTEYPMQIPAKFAETIDDVIRLMAWQSNDAFSVMHDDEPALLPVVSFHPQRHLSQYPDQLMHVIGHSGLTDPV